MSEKVLVVDDSNGLTLKRKQIQDIDGYQAPTDAQTQAAVDAWMDAHSGQYVVPDNSLTYAKLVKGTLNFVTPEMYGAKGDGTADDTTAFVSACETGLPVNLGRNIYRITSSQTVNGCIVYGGTIKETASGQITGANVQFYDVTFDLSGKTASWQAGLVVTGGNNTIKNCKFGQMSARDWAQQLDVNGCASAIIENCDFGVVHVEQINGIEGDNYGVGRHIRAVDCESVLISYCNFSGFYGQDTNYFEDSDCVHTSRCDLAVIENSHFSGYWKSAIKNQFKNVIVNNCYFDNTENWYCIRSHENSANAFISNCIVKGKADIAFYFQGVNNKVCGSSVSGDMNIIAMTASDTELSFRNNSVSVTHHTSIISSYSTPTIFYVGTGGYVENDSDITGDTHLPYIFSATASTTDFTLCNLKREIKTQSTTGSNYRKLKGVITVMQDNVFIGCEDLTVRGYGVTRSNFNSCSNIKCYEESNGYVAITSCSNMYVEKTYHGNSAVANLTTSTNIIINVYGYQIGANLLQVNDATTTGITINYVDTNVNIYNPNSVTLAYKAKSMLA